MILSKEETDSIFEKFFNELRELELKYNISISTGCGCCDAGYYINSDSHDSYQSYYSRTEDERQEIN